VERGSRATVGTTRDPFVEALGAEPNRAERFLERYGDGARNARGAEASPNAEVMPAADPLTASAAPFDADAVNRPIATDESPHPAAPLEAQAGDEPKPERG
jgi:hypothetical protein